MSRGRQAFRQSDIEKALKAATAAGLAVKSLSIRDGEIFLAFVGEEPEVETDEGEVNPWERIAS